MRYSFAVLLLSVSAAFLGCTSGKETAISTQTPKIVDPGVVGFVGGEPVLFDDLIAQYDRNNISDTKDESVRKQEMTEFLDLYLLYRAKLAEAREKGVYDDAALNEELRQYELQYAFPFWMENEIQAQLVDEYIERSRVELEASHILVSIPQVATPEDTLKAYNTLIEARNKFLAGEDFERLSMQYSSMQDGRSMGGSLGFFSAGWAVKPFEDAAYATKPGEVSMPFRSPFGYHIVHVKSQRPNNPDRYISHIYWNTNSPTSNVDSLLQIANSVYDKLKNGENWDMLVARYTQDLRSVDSNGEIGWVNMDAYDHSLTAPVFALNPNQKGMAQAPLQTSYGIHILRLDSVRTFLNADHEREDALAKLKQLPTFNDQRGLVFSRIRSEVGEMTSMDVFDAFKAAGNGKENDRVGDTPLTPQLAERIIYGLDGQSHSVAQFQNFLKAQMPELVWGRLAEEHFDFFINTQLENALLRITRQRFPEYTSTISNYLDGLAVFKLTDDEVWNYVRTDTATVKKMFENNPQQYQFPQRYTIVRLSARNDSLLHVAQAQIRNGLPADSVRKEVSGLGAVRETVTDLSNEPFQHLSGLNEGDFSDVFTFRGAKNLLLLEKVTPPGPMSFEEAYFRIVSEYQPVREQEWNDYLTRKYKIQAVPENIR